MTRLKIAIVSILIVPIATFAGVGIGTMINPPVEQPSCPTEDSCKIDYHDGQWIITPVVP